MKRFIPSIISIGLVLGIALFANILSGFVYSKKDLTSDKRFTLTEKTIEVVQTVESPIYVRILLDGEFPAGFKRLQSSTIELLDELRSYSGNIQWTLENPTEGSEQDVGDRMKVLSSLGVQGVNLYLNETGSKERKLIFPHAIINYQGRTHTVSLLEPQTPGSGLSPDAAINKSINLLEYKFANAIRILERDSKPIIAFLQGHGELNELQVKDFTNTLRPHYAVGVFKLDSTYHIPNRIKLLMIAKPTQPFSDKDKFKIDQYIMNGGKVLWMLDRIEMSLDSLRGREAYVPRDYPLNIEDILFKYGIRLEPCFALDKQASVIPQVIGYQGGKPQQELFPWYYDPLISPTSEHPVAKSIGLVNLQFASAIDADDDLMKPVEGVRREVLLTTSDYSKKRCLPGRVGFDIIQNPPTDNWFDEQNKPVAVLYEGTFPSFYTNRVDEEFKQELANIGTDFKEKSIATSQIVIGDGDIVKNLITPEGGHMPLGFNQFSGQIYDNKNFLLNCVEYLMGDDGLLAARTKKVQLRLLDTTRAQEEKGFWQFINLGLPLLFLLLFGGIWNTVRWYKYARKN